LRQMLKALVSASALAGILLLAGCSDSTPPPEAKTEAPKKPTVPTGPITALTAYYELYKIARQIAPDLQTASITGNDVEGVKSEEGKYAQWTVVFVSASKRQATTFIYTTAPTGNLLKGANNSGSQPWGGATRDATPFSNGDVSVDSDAAYKAAAERAADWLAKNKEKPVTVFALGQSAQLPAPMWYVMWGDKKAGGYAVYVNASTGKVFGK
jgi:ribosomal protein S11